MSSCFLYDRIGATYPHTRRTEPRIAAQIWAALGDAGTVVNVGAGTGSYEPPDRDVTAVEPSALMRVQRPAGAAACVAATADNLSFDDQSFDAAMAVSTIHHWPDPVAGLREMRRVARRVVVFTFDNRDAAWGTKIGHDVEQRAVHNLQRDLASGRWAKRNRDLLRLDMAELGLRLLIA